jgi:Ser/Thr protein kinase RdoA (MazF antagonist)
MTTANFDAETMAQQALEAWGLQSAKRELVSTSENIVFRVDPDNGQPLVLRLHRPWYHNLQELVSERQWTRALSDSSIRAPLPVHTLDGHDYVLVKDSVSGKARYAGMAHWVEGKSLAHIISSGGDFTPHFRRLGRLAARIHNQASGWRPPSGFVRHSLDADGLMGLSPWWGRFCPFWASPELTASERVRLEHLRGTIHDRLLRLETEPATYSMIHADLHPGNLVVDGERLHVIDFDDAGFGWHMYELAVGVFSYQSDPHFPKSWMPFSKVIER